MKNLINKIIILFNVDSIARCEFDEFIVESVSEVLFSEAKGEDGARRKVYLLRRGENRPAIASLSWFERRKTWMAYDHIRSGMPYDYDDNLLKMANDRAVRKFKEFVNG